jgi:hypothetical protein
VPGIYGVQIAGKLAKAIGKKMEGSPDQVFRLLLQFLWYIRTRIVRFFSHV